MTKRTNDFLSFAEAMQSMLSENKLQAGITELDVKQAWKEVMGAGVVTYTSELKLKKDVLFVKLKSSALREELSHGKDKIVSMLNEHLSRDVINTIKLI